jgi:uncharacterized protein YidB (DUF937 family)
MKLKRTIASLGAAATVVGGTALVAAPALAQDEGATDATEDTTLEAPQEQRRHTRFLALTEVLGIDADALHERLHNSETIADIAAEQGVAVDDVIAALLGEAEERLDAAVADERLTQAEAEERLGSIEERITEFVNGEIDFPGPGHHRHGGFGLGAAAELLGLDGAELMEQLQAGSTLADIAAEQGISTDELADAMSAPMIERLDQAVADGDLTQAEADERLADLEEKIDDMISGELPAGEPGFGGGFRGRGGPGEGGFGEGGFGEGGFGEGPGGPADGADTGT